MALYDALEDLPLTVDDVRYARRARDTSSGFERVTTVIRLEGPDGAVGRGEDVTYEAADHDALHDADPDFGLPGEWTHAELSTLLGDTDLFHGRPPDRGDFRDYRRWGFESAALDLALRQADTDLATALDRSYAPVRFVASTRLGEPPRFDRVTALVDRAPDVELKLDPTSDWTDDLVERLAATGRVRILDLKGHYEGTVVDQDVDPALYETVFERFPDAVVEDPAWTDATEPLLRKHADRLSWDAPIHGVDDVEGLPVEPRWCNVKPSRFGSVRSLLATVEHCDAHGIAMYGGGQFELDVGREHLWALASLFYPESPNDVAPGPYNEPEPPASLPASPLRPPETPSGFAWPSPDLSG